MKLIFYTNKDRKIMTGLFIFLAILSLSNLYNINKIPKESFGMFIFVSNIGINILMYLLLIAFMEK